MEPDLIMLEEHQKSLKVLDKETSLLQAKIQGVGKRPDGRTLIELCKELNMRGDQCKKTG